jgi:predicted adenine nucleotide alpha hydrolase (AANH) superfamily ATPase
MPEPYIGDTIPNRSDSGHVPARVLLHICCAPCATTVVRRLQEQGFAVHGFFYNPNIHPEKEYYQRLLEAQRLCKLWSIPLEIGEYDRDRWQAAVKGLEKEPEGGERCRVCYRFRLSVVAEKAKELGIGIIATTLTISPRKRPDVVNPIGREVVEELELKFLEADWKKKDGYKQSLDTCRELHIYRQHYCGCRYSYREPTPVEQVHRRDAKSAEKKQETAVTECRLQSAEGKVQSAQDEAPSREADTRAKWELTPLERKQRRDKKPKPWTRR